MTTRRKALTRALRGVACPMLVILGTWAGGVRLAEASCATTSLHVSAEPILSPSQVIPVRWWIDPGCLVIETGLLLGRDPTALAPAGQPLYGPHTTYQQELWVKESGPYWVAAYARDEAGAVVQSVPQPVLVVLPPAFPDGPHGSHGAPPSYTGRDDDFLLPAGEPHYASLRDLSQQSQTFRTDAIGGAFVAEGSTVRQVGSTNRNDVLVQQEPALEVGGAPFAVPSADVAHALDELDALFGALRYPRPGLYLVGCSVFARFSPDPVQTGPTCVPSTGTPFVFLNYAQAGGGGSAARASATYVIPRPPAGKRVQRARLRTFVSALVTTPTNAFSGVRLSGRAPTTIERTGCFNGFLITSCDAWVTWDFTDEARALAAQGGGELHLTLDPVPPLIFQGSNGPSALANYTVLLALNYPWTHRFDNFSLTLTFEAECPRALTLSIPDPVVRPIIPAFLSGTTGQLVMPTVKGPARRMPTEATVEATVKTCVAEGQTPQPVEVTFEVQAPAAGTSGAAGHLHASVPRPTGLIQDLDRGQAANHCTVTTFTDGTGSCAVTYRAGEVGGVETVVARADGFAEAQTTVTVKVPGLQNLATFNGGRLWRLTGDRPGLHTDNHWGTSNAISKTALMAAQVVEDYSASIGVNDMSLISGGMFDIRGDWDGSFHRTHRQGTGVDVDGCALSLIPNNPNPQSNDEKTCPAGWVVLPKEDYFDEVCRKQGGRLASEATIHCEFPQ